MNTEVELAQEDDDDEDWLIYDDLNGEGDGKGGEDSRAWQILIVDDDLDVHAVTRLALHKVRYKNRGLRFLSAYSRQEAYAMLRDTPEIALVLLDVVMETDDAGLSLARQIRNELNNQLVRVVLRTGQPGQAPEQSVVMEYDINDYKSKTELTAQKLFTSVISSLRAYESLLLAEKSRAELLASMAKTKILKQALDQHSLVAITDQYGKITYANDKFCHVTQYTQQELLGQDYRIFNSAYHSKQFFADLWRSIGMGQTWQGELRNRARDGSYFWVETTIVPFPGPDGQGAQYVAIHTDVTERRRAQENWQSANAGLLHVLNASPLALSIDNLESRQRVFANQNFVELFQTTQTLAHGADALQFFSNPQDYEDILQRLRQGETIQLHSLTMQTRHRDSLKLQASFSLMEFQGATAVLGWYQRQE
ncbi:PAS domain-containing protein [Massilia sp. W12]|uniref:PAS domain-containing protein n=1 Tax=Massilia sp. W12 TaxID=3126507 RepID=UPI0030CF4A31